MDVSLGWEDWNTPDEQLRPDQFFNKKKPSEDEELPDSDQYQMGEDDDDDEMPAAA